VRVGFIQFAPVLGDLSATIERIDRQMAGAGVADLWVLPELCNSGYNFTSWSQAWETAEETPDGPFVRYLESLCREHGFQVVSGLNEREGVHLYNSAVLVGPGGYVGRYRKLHLFLHEKDYFQPGDAGLPVFDIGPCRVGMLVCFDWLFPEVWRILALEGADLICHPSNLVLPGLAQRAVPVHALTNRVYVVTANRIGTEGDLTFTGLSTVAGPRGEILWQASASDEEVGIVDLDVSLARDKRMTPRNHVFGDRRPEAYSALLKTTGNG
jgi:predicted amidohydrolase